MTDRGWYRPCSTARCFVQHKLARESGFAIVIGCFSRIKQILGRTETRTRDRMRFQSIRTVRKISRGDRARIATCSLTIATDRLKEHYIIECRRLNCYNDIIVVVIVTVTSVVVVAATLTVAMTVTLLNSENVAPVPQLELTCFF